MKNEKVRVLIVSPLLGLSDTHNYYGGAISNIAYNLFFSLSKYVKIYVFVRGYNLTKSLPSYLKLYVYPTIFGRYIGFIRKADTILKQEKITIITQMYFYYGISFNLFRKIKDYPFVIGMCELPHPRLRDEIGIFEYIFAKFGKKLAFPLFRRTLKHCDLLIAVNEAVKELYTNFLSKDKIKVIPYGVDVRHFKYSSLSSSHNILAVSRLIKRRGLDYLVDVMPIILKKYPDTTLHLVGSGPREEILLKKAKELGVSSKVIFYNNVSSDELVNMYRNCYVFCHLSFADGWNQPALEAMASGRPVVCTDAPHNSMVINEKTGFLIPFGDVDMLSKKIMMLFGDHRLAEKMGLEGRKEVEKKYNWDEIGRRYYEVFDSLVGEMR